VAIDGYWWLLVTIILVVVSCSSIGGNYINGYC
jgi:hypothetical protein